MATIVRKRKRSIVDEFVDRILEEAERQGMSLSELARRAGCGRPYLHRVVHKEQIPTIQWAEKVAAVLGMELSLTTLKK